MSGIATTVNAQGFTFTRNLSVGSSGADVTALQTLLIAKGHLNISAPTGYFGLMTRAAVAAWQQSLGISPAVGYFGPISRAKISAAVSLPPVQIPAPVITPPAPVSDPITTSTPATGAPVRLTIPKLGVNAAVLGTGVTADGSLDAPKNIFDIGWYKLGTVPGAEGSAVLTGHVSRIQNNVMTAKGVFYDLNRLVKGDTVQVQNDRGETMTFVVRETRIYNPGDSAAEVFYSQSGSHMNLITCDGTWDQATLSYSGRLVVFTDKVN